MFKKLMAIVLMVVVSVTFLTACESSQGDSQKRIVKLLTSKKMEGRLAGTAGNELAVEAIRQEFARIGLDPYEGEDYGIDVPYRSVELREISLKVNMKDGSVKELVYGKHYMEQVIRMNLEATAELTMNPDGLTDKKVFLASSQEDYEVAKKANPRFILLQKKAFTSYPLNRSQDVPVVQVNPDTYDFLKRKKAEIQSISLKMNYEDKRSEISNLVGKIPGTSSEGKDPHRLIISAHIDSMGERAGARYEGASGASGVSMLLSLAEELKKASASKPFYSDVIFFVFNGRENGFQGSERILMRLGSKEIHSSAINLDEIGVKGGKVMLTAAQSGEKLASSLSGYFGQQGVNVQKETGMDGDHASFARNLIPAVSIGLADDSMRRTVLDRESGIDYGEMNKLAIQLTAYIEEQDRKALQPHEDEAVDETNSMDSSEFQYFNFEADIINKAKSGLGFRQYMRVVDEEQGIDALVAGDSKAMNLEEMNTMYPGYSLPEEIDGFTLGDVYVGFNSQGIAGAPMESLKPNELYLAQEDPAAKDIRSMAPMYMNPEGEFLRLEIMRADSLDPDLEEFHRMMKRTTVREEGKEFTVYELEGVPVAVTYSFKAGGQSYLARMIKYIAGKDNSIRTVWDYSGAETAALLGKIDWEQIFPKS